MSLGLVYEFYLIANALCQLHNNVQAGPLTNDFRFVPKMLLYRLKYDAMFLFVKYSRTPEVLIPVTPLHERYHGSLDQKRDG